MSGDSIIAMFKFAAKRLEAFAYICLIFAVPLLSISYHNREPSSFQIKSVSVEKGTYPPPYSTLDTNVKITVCTPTLMHSPPMLDHVQITDSRGQNYSVFKDDDGKQTSYIVFAPADPAQEREVVLNCLFSKAQIPTNADAVYFDAVVKLGHLKSEPIHVKIR